MKSITKIVLLFLPIIICQSCKKDADSVKGEWKWIYSTEGGIAGGIVKPSDGATVSLTLNSNYKYATYLNNQTNTQGSYQIKSSAGISDIEFDKAINTDKLFLEKEEGIIQTTDSLFLINYNVEASPTAVFIKVK